MTNPNVQFEGTIPATYDRYLGPLLFEPYARDLAGRLPWVQYRDVLELAAGTGRLTRHLREAMAKDAHLTASDLNPDMLTIAQERHPGLHVHWKQADAQALPFADASFDAVACQFGVMFFPDKQAACVEVRRVLKPGGLFAFSTWDSLEHNPLGAIARETVAPFFTTDPPTFCDVPFSLANRAQLRGWLEAASFEVDSITAVPLVGESPSASHAAEGMIAGNPTIIAIRERATAPAAEIVQAAAAALSSRYGTNPCCLPMQALVITAHAA